MPYKSLCHLVDAATTHYLELFQITVLLLESSLLLIVIQISFEVCIDVTLYDELFYHLHNREKFLSPLVTEDKFDRCHVIHPWITLVPLDLLMARHTSGVVLSIAYRRAYV